MQEELPYSSERLFAMPSLDGHELAVVSEIDELRQRLRHQTRDAQQWVGLLRRVSFARAIRGSNSIEGYNVTLDDAVAAAEGEEPLDATAEAWAAVTGYRDAMTYILGLSADPHFEHSEALLRSLHFMMVKHDSKKSPGRYRPGLIYVKDEETGEIVYEGPPSDRVPNMMATLVQDLNAAAPQLSAVVRAAMAHLNLVMIHPFRDGNGRMARALQTLEEYLGRNTPAYYAVLADVGRGSWHPEDDARPWVRFMLTAHLRQAKTLLKRVREYERLWDALEHEVAKERLAARTLLALSDAAMGLRVRNATYRLLDDEAAAPATAARDLKAMTSAGLLEPRGQTRGRHYVGSPRLRAIWQRVRADRVVDDMVDPFAATN
jgi:Fic family protein